MQPSRLSQSIFATLSVSPKQAERDARTALKSAPSDHDLLFVSGLVALRLSKTRDARNFFVRAINTGRATPADYLNAGLAEAKIATFDSALKILSAGMARFPEDIEVFGTTVSLALTHGDLDTAATLLHEGWSRWPDHATLHALTGTLRERRGDLPGAIAAHEAAVALAPTDKGLRDLSRLQAFSNQPRKAMESARRALELAPGQTASLYTLAWREVEAGEFDAARARFAQTLTDPTLACDSLRMLTQLPGETPGLDVPAMADALRAAAQTNTDKGHLDMARYNAAVTSGGADPLPFLISANRHYAKDRSYDVRADAAYHQSVLTAYDQTLAPPADSPDTVPRPIFILGMIRSGTTLLDRLLSAAPGTASLGEVATVDRFFRTALAAPDTPVDLAPLIRRYGALQSLGGTSVVTLDKMPFNYLYIGWLHRAFPGARILLMQRDMRDVAASAYENWFDTAPMSFTFREDWLSAKFDLYAAQITAWKERQVSMLEVSYERLVSETDRCLQEITAYCGLDPIPSADPASGGGSIRTASFAQARQPVNTRSVGRWQTMRPALPNLCKPE